MGFFSTRTIHNVGTSAFRVIEDKNIVDTFKVSTANAVFLADDLADALAENAIQSVAVKSNLAYSFGKNGYVFGLPSGEVFFNNHSSLQIQQAIEAIEGKSILLDYYYLSPLNGIHQAWEILVKDYGYSTETNLIDKTKVNQSNDVYLVDMQLEVPFNYASVPQSFDRLGLAVWGKPPSAGKLPNKVTINPETGFADTYYKSTGFKFNEEISEPQVRVYWYTKQNNGTELESSFVIPVPEMNANEDWFQASYFVLQNEKQVLKYFSYKKGSGTNSILDSEYSPGTGDTESFGKFYPNMYLRLNKKNINEDKTSLQYRHTKRMMKYFGISLDQVTDSIKENPDFGDVATAFMQLAVPADSNTPEDVEYLYKFFDLCHAADKANSITGNTSDVYLSRYGLNTTEIEASNVVFNPRAVTIKDSAFEMSMVYSQISKVIKAGKHKPNARVGSYSSEKLLYTYLYPGAIDGLDLPPNAAIGFGKAIPHRIYRKQIAEYFYEEITVIDLSMKYKVFEEFETTLGDDEKEILLIPLDRNILETMTTRKREKLIFRAMHFVFNSHQVSKLAWYKTAGFGSFIRIVGLAVTLFSMGTDNGLFAGLAAAATAGTQALVQFILIQLAKYIVITQGLKLIVKTLGVENSVIIATLVAVYGALKGMGAESFQAAFATAKEYLQLATGLIQTAAKVLAEELKLIVDDLLALDVLKSEKQKELDSANDLLRSSGVLDPMLVLGVKPSEYFYWSVHAGNIGTLVVEDTHTFVNRSLRLPTFADTMIGVSV